MIPFPGDIPLARFEATVWDHPRKPGEGAIAYIVRITELATQAHAEVKDMPEVRLPYRDAE